MTPHPIIAAAHETVAELYDQASAHTRTAREAAERLAEPTTRLVTLAAEEADLVRRLEAVRREITDVRTAREAIDAECAHHTALAEEKAAAAQYYERTTLPDLTRMLEPVPAAQAIAVALPPPQGEPRPVIHSPDWSKEDDAWHPEDAEPVNDDIGGPEPKRYPDEQGWEVDKTAKRREHIGGNAEDCPACDGTNPPWPFICPGPDDLSAPGVVDSRAQVAAITGGTPIVAPPVPYAEHKGHRVDVIDHDGGRTRGWVTGVSRQAIVLDGNAIPMDQVRRVVRATGLALAVADAPPQPDPTVTVPDTGLAPPRLAPPEPSDLPRHEKPQPPRDSTKTGGFSLRGIGERLGLAHRDDQDGATT